MKTIKVFCIWILLLTGCASPNINSPAETPMIISTNALPPTPTATPVITATSTPEPTPLDFSGEGDTVLDISSWPHLPGVLSYIGQSDNGFFAVVPFGADGNPMSSICNVNSFDPFKGACLFNADGAYATHLEVKTTGNWIIKINPLTKANALSVPGIFEGNDNDVIVLTGSSPKLATITGNIESQLFIFVPYKIDGTKMISLVNTTDPYQDTVSIDSDTAIIEVMATGSWSVAIADK